MKTSRLVMLAGGAVAVLCTALGLFADEAPAEPATGSVRPPASMTVDVVRPTRMTFARTLAATGTVRPRDELVIGSDLSGVRLVAVHAGVGTPVRAGQLLAQADDALLRAQLAQQEALVARARAALRLAEMNLARARRLEGSGAISLEELENRVTTHAAARAELDLALARRRELALTVTHTRIVAPASGIISARLATVGAVVQPGTELFRLIREGELEWLAELPGQALAKVSPEAGARLLTAEGRVVDAAVRLVAPTIDSTTRNGLVHVTLPKDAPFAAGDLARGEILAGAAQALAVPEAAVLTRDSRPFVYLVDDEGIARATRVETGVRRDGAVEIIGGLDEEARVVTTGAGFVKDGDSVRVASESTQLLAAAGDSP